VSGEVRSLATSSVPIVDNVIGLARAFALPNADRSETDQGRAIGSSNRLAQPRSLMALIPREMHNAARAEYVRSAAQAYAPGR
jgi:hypothetical protein